MLTPDLSSGPLNPNSNFLKRNETSNQSVSTAYISWDPSDLLKSLSSGPITLWSTSVPFSVIKKMSIGIKRIFLRPQSDDDDQRCLIRIKIPVPYDIFVDHNVITKQTFAFKPLKLTEKWSYVSLYLPYDL